MSASSRKKKISAGTGRLSLDKGGKKICVFCEDPTINEELHGKLLSQSKSGVSAHYFCLLFSSGLCQNGKSKQGLLGFLPEDISREVRRGVRLRCSYCRKPGATVGCVKGNCKTMYHFACGRTNGVLFQFFDTFGSYCLNHRPQQKVPASKDRSTVCSICMSACVAAPCPESLRAPCCKKDWYHRDCVQHHATSAGLHYFKCPLCNNKDQFQHEMLTYGIYIPDQDASWETEPHAFRDLLERYRQCDAKLCRCAEGRKYDKDSSKWEIILCDFCGSRGSHVGCIFLIKDGRVYICPECKDIDTRTGGKLLHKSPKRKPVKKKSLEMSPEKGKNSYPGPSGKLRKTGLPQTFVTSPGGQTHPLSPSWSSPQSSPTSKNTKRRARSSGETGDDKKAKRRRMNSSTFVDDYEDTVPLSKLIKQFKSNNSTEIGISNQSSDVNRLSVGCLKQADTKKGKGRIMKRNTSLNDKAQTTLTGWLKLGCGASNKSSTDKEPVTKSKIPNIFSKKSPAKRPSIIEWRGKQLLIRSPRVQLENVDPVRENKSKKVLEYKPRKLDLHTDPVPRQTRKDDAALPVKVQRPLRRRTMENENGRHMGRHTRQQTNSDQPTAKSGPALLASLDCDFRVTRKMVSATEVIRYTYSDSEDSPTASQEPELTRIKAEPCSPNVRDTISDSPAKHLRNSTKKIALNEEKKAETSQAITLNEAKTTETSHAIALNEEKKAETSKAMSNDCSSANLSFDSPSKNLRNSIHKAQITNDSAVNCLNRPSPAKKSSPAKVSVAMSLKKYFVNSAQEDDLINDSDTKSPVRMPRKQSVMDIPTVKDPKIDSPAKNLRNSVKKLKLATTDTTNDKTNVLDKCSNNDPQTPTNLIGMQTFAFESLSTPKQKQSNLEKHTPISNTKSSIQSEQENTRSPVLRSSSYKATNVLTSTTTNTQDSPHSPLTQNTVNSQSVQPPAKAVLDTETDSPTTNKVKTLKSLIGKYPQKFSSKSPKTKLAKPDDGFTAIKENRAKDTTQNNFSDLTTQQLRENVTSSTQAHDLGVTQDQCSEDLRNRLLKYTIKNIKPSVPTSAELARRSPVGKKLKMKQGTLDNLLLSNDERYTNNKFNVLLSKGRLIVEEKLCNPVSDNSKIYTLSPNSRMLRHSGAGAQSPQSKTHKSLSPSYNTIDQKSIVVHTKSSQMTIGNGNIIIRSNPPSPENGKLVSKTANQGIVYNTSVIADTFSQKSPAVQRKTKVSTSPKRSLASDKSLMAQYYAMASPPDKVKETMIDVDDIIDLPEILDDVC